MKAKLLILCAVLCMASVCRAEIANLPGDEFKTPMPYAFAINPREVLTWMDGNYTQSSTVWPGWERDTEVTGWAAYDSHTLFIRGGGSVRWTFPYGALDFTDRNAFYLDVILGSTRLMTWQVGILDSKTDTWFDTSRHEISNVMWSTPPDNFIPFSEIPWSQITPGGMRLEIDVGWGGTVQIEEWGIIQTSAVPEPGSAILMLIGFLFLTFTRRTLWRRSYSS